MNAQFARISTGGTLKPADIEGHLLIVEPTEYVPEIATAMGTSDAIRVDVHDLTEKETTTNVLWFSKVLVSSLRPLIGRSVLGVMGKGTAKQGQSAPWMLHDASDSAEAVEAANAYFSSRPNLGVSGVSMGSEPEEAIDAKQGLANALKGLPGAKVNK